MSLKETLLENLLLHFTRKLNCGTLINLEHFGLIFEQFKKERRRQNIRIAVQQVRKRKKAESPESHDKVKENQKEKQRKYMERRRTESP